MQRWIGLGLAAALLCGTAIAVPAKAETALRVGLSEDPDSFDPTPGNSYVGRIVFMSICDKLLDADQKAQLTPMLATEWSWAEDLRSVTLKLRQGVKFQDGEPFNAEAVKFTLERHLTQPDSRRKSEIQQIKSIDVVDANTIKLNLEVPFVALLAQLADRAGIIISPKAAKALGPEFGQKPVCAGPYRLTNRVPQGRITLERFADYWDKDKIHFDKITFEPVVDDQARVASVQAGQLEMIERVPAADFDRLSKDSRLKTYGAVALAYTGLTFNDDPKKDGYKVSVNKDKRIRQALELSIDRDAINQVVFNGTALPGNQWQSPQSPWYVKSVPIPKRDIGKAKALLAQAGEPSPAFTMLVPNGGEVTRVAEVIQAMAGEAGFKIKIEVAEFQTSLQRAYKGDYETFLIGWSGRVDPDGNVHVFDHTGGAQNYGGYSNPAMDKLLDEARTKPTMAERMAVYEKIAQMQAEDLPRIYLYHPKWLFASTSKLSGYEAYPDGLIRPQGLKLN
jgi:peptide/nickel transport system substrate-binding protein